MIGFKIKTSERRPIGRSPYWEVHLEKCQYTKLAELFFTCRSKEKANDLSARLASALQDAGILVEDID